MKGHCDPGHEQNEISRELNCPDQAGFRRRQEWSGCCLTATTFGPFDLAHTMTFTQVEGERPARTIYELKEVTGGTELTLMSDSVPGTKIGKMVAGGPFIVNNLKPVVETGRPNSGAPCS